MPPLFYGRKTELDRFESLWKIPTARLITIYGRRRVGKSRLAKQFGKKHNYLAFSGLPPTAKTTAQSQRDEFFRQLRTYFPTLPELNTTSWGHLFHQLAQLIPNQKTVILLDEISWMGSKDPDFLGHIKTTWDQHFKTHPNLVLILCGSISSWIEQNILSSTGFLGRISLKLHLTELPLHHCNAFWQGQHVSAYEKCQFLAITGGIPKYLEELIPTQHVEQAIKQLCFEPSGLLFNEFEHIFSDLFSSRSALYKKIVSLLVNGPLDFTTICTKLGYAKTGLVSEYLNDLISAGFIRKDPTWNLKTTKKSSLNHYRLKDNYTRFYLKYIQPKADLIARGHYQHITLNQLPGWVSLMGYQFESLILTNRQAIIQKLGINPTDIINDNPYFQRQTSRQNGCQIDYLIHTTHTLYVCEIKFSMRQIATDIVPEIEKKIAALAVPKHHSIRPVLIHVNGITEALEDTRYFNEVIDFGSLLEI